MKNLGLENVEEARDFEAPPAEGYICRITSVEDVVNKEYLRIEYDIAEGDFKDYYSQLYKNRGFWGGSMIRSYKEKALPFFKSFITAVEKSNPGFHFDSDEKKLIGKLLGLVLAEEEYLSNSGEVKTRLYADKPRSVEAIRTGDYKVPLKKLLEQPPADTAPVSNDFATGDVPF